MSTGKHTISARAIDNAGNMSDPISYSWMIDMAAPIVTITSHPNSVTGETNAAFQFIATDSVSGIDNIECRIDGSSYQSCASPKNYNNLTGGNHIFSVRATDKAGNISTTQTYEWLIDTQGPDLMFTLTPGNVVYIGNKGKIRFIADDGNGSGVNKAQCFYNNSPYPCAVDITYNFPATQVSSHRFDVTVTDNVGNSTTKTLEWQTLYSVVVKQANLKVEGDSPVDILFVVDNSGSMNEERANLAQRIDGFLAKINGLNWQLAVTTTDVDNNIEDWAAGRLTNFGNNTHILDPSMNLATAQQMFGTRVQAYHQSRNPNGIKGGSASEQGIYATVKMLERDLSGDAINDAFVRDGADLAVVILSDEDEKSNGSNVEYTPQAFLDFVSKSYPGKGITWHSIVIRSGDHQCKKSGGAYGANYEELSKLTGYGQPGGAIIGSVCEQNYTNQLKDIGQSVQDMQKTVSLECSPIDNDGSGQPDMEVSYKAEGAGRYSPYNAPYTIQGQKLVFADFLPAGDFKFNFVCTK